MAEKPRNRTVMPRGRGAASNPSARFDLYSHVAVDDGWGTSEAQPPWLRTTLAPDHSKSVIARNGSPDVPFDRSINPYRGCEHGCVYCYARPTHAYLGLSPGLDFETRLFYKPNADRLLAEELSRSNYHCAPIAIGANTDPYQPVERKLELTRRILRVLKRFNHPVLIVTKSALVERDLDLLTDMADRNLTQVLLSVTTLSAQLARRMEPRATAPMRRIETLRRVTDARVPTGVLVAPVIPGLNDCEMEKILSNCREAGAEYASYVLLRLPHEVRLLFKEWLLLHYPDKVRRVLSLMKSTHRGREYVSEFGERMRGSGLFAELIADRFKLACKRLSYSRTHRKLDCSRFARPQQAGVQLPLL